MTHGKRNGPRDRLLGDKPFKTEHSRKELGLCQGYALGLELQSEENKPVSGYILHRLLLLSLFKHTNFHIFILIYGQVGEWTICL